MDSDKFIKFYDEIMQTDDALTTDRRYEIFEEIGSGATKKVYRANDNLCGREVALIRPVDDSKAMQDLFEREARLTAFLQHPNILPVYDITQDKDGQFFTTKLLSVLSLDTLEPDLTFFDKIQVFKSLCQAVDFAHSKGVLHLDLKPNNICLDKQYNLYVIDWGLAEVHCTESDSSPLDIPQLAEKEIKETLINRGICGTPGYMAPEQEIKQHSARTDIYALGVILKEMFSDSSSESLDAIIKKMTKTAPEKRYNSISEVILEIDSIISGFAPASENAGLAKQLKLFYRRNRAACLVTLCAVILIALLNIFYITRLQQSFADTRQKQQQAEKHLNDFLAEKELTAEISARLVPIYLSQTKTLFDNFRLNEAELLLQQTLLLQPKNEAALLLKAQLLFTEGKYSEAGALFARFGTKGKQKLCEKMHASGIEKQILLNAIEARPLRSRRIYKMGLDSRSIHEIASLENNLPHLKSHIEKMAQGYSIDFSRNNRFFNIDYLWKLKIQHLDLSHNSLENINALNGHTIETLNLSHTRVNALASLRDTKIKSINLSHSFIKNVLALKNTGVEKLDISFTSVTSIPKELMMNLKVLNIQGTAITELPKGHWPLEVLDLRQNTVFNRDSLKSLNLKLLITDEAEIKF